MLLSAYLNQEVRVIYSAGSVSVAADGKLILLPHTQRYLVAITNGVIANGVIGFDYTAVHTVSRSDLSGVVTIILH